MPQRFKTIYFSDYPAESSRRRNVKLAFGASDRAVFERINDLSSQELRELIGFSSYSDLRGAASQRGLSLNAFCVRRLRDAVVAPAAPSQALLPGFEDVTPTLDPLQATFRGGHSEPLHGWYPYLEGYSPDFVSHVIREYAPAARHVLDPFAGTGTTPLTVCRLGVEASYCELNPLLQFLIETKIAALGLPARTRHSVAKELRSYANAIAHGATAVVPDDGLRLAFGEAFGKSVFFARDTFETVLRLRSFIDAVACTNPIVAALFAVAVVACLIPSSLLIRRGDVRFRTPTERERGIPDIRTLVPERLAAMARDILQAPTLKRHPRLLCADARSLAALPSLNVDTVVTSPPYLNGTNYFRNTKIELWFLRCLRSKKDLSRFRLRAITAGINDVTVGKPAETVTDSVARVVSRLQASAYDSRIPRLVKTYFHDMVTVFAGLANHLARNARLVIDIGDSAYAGVRVETPRLLSEALQAIGLQLEQEVTLRKRMSRGGIPLRQSLLVFRLRRSRRASTPRTAYAWLGRWHEFKKTLPHQIGDYAKRNWGHPLHSLCSYQGKMKPSLASLLVRAFVPPGGKILDPFGGVGTIAFEASLLGAQAWSFDISPAAVQIARAKLRPAEGRACEALLGRLERFIDRYSPTREEIEDASRIRFNGPLPEYFHPETFREILAARRFFLKIKLRSEADALVFASLLHILHGNRPYALSRRSHPITPFAPSGAADYRPMMERLRAKVARSLAVGLPGTFVRGESLFQDATASWPQEVDRLDAVVTSPPFFDSTRFYLANWMRLWFCGWGADDFRYRPLSFVDERQKQSFRIYEAVFRQARERVKTRGAVVLHLGKSSKCDMAAELAEVARPWFNVVDVFSECVKHCESHGIRDKGTVVAHTYLVLV